MSDYYHLILGDVLKKQNKKPITKLNANMTVDHLRKNKINLKGLYGSIREEAVTHNDMIRILLAKKKLTNDKQRTAKKIIKKYVGSTKLDKIAEYIEEHANQDNTNTNHNGVIIPDKTQQESNQPHSTTDTATPIPPTSSDNTFYNATNDKGDNQLAQKQNQQQGQNLNSSSDTDNN